MPVVGKNRLKTVRIFPIQGEKGKGKVTVIQTGRRTKRSGKENKTAPISGAWGKEENFKNPIVRRRSTTQPLRRRGRRSLLKNDSRKVARQWEKRKGETQTRGIKGNNDRLKKGGVVNV